MEISTGTETELPIEKMASHKLIMLIISLTNFHQFNHLHIREKDPSLLTTMVLNEHVVFLFVSFVMRRGQCSICRVDFFFFFFFFY